MDKRKGFMRQSALVVAVLVLLSSPARSADADNGGRLARRWCAACHVVIGSQRQASSEATTFSAMARQPGFDEARLAFFLLDPHPRMPDMSLSRSEAADLAAYIVTQK
jgi:mono/diheme cytochrome c family protein